jgi:hypothetical protein
VTSRWILLAVLLPVASLAEEIPETAAPARTAKAEARAEATPGGAKRISGMSILGNQEAPKSLVIVPWKSSELGESLAVESMLDDSRRPVDKDVFMRELGYYEISTE